VRWGYGFAVEVFDFATDRLSRVGAPFRALPLRPQYCATRALLVFALTVASPEGGVRIARGIRYPAWEQVRFGLAVAARLEPATVVPQVGVPFTPDALAVV